MVKKASGGQGQAGATQRGNIRNGLLLSFERLLWNNFRLLYHESTWSKIESTPNILLDYLWSGIHFTALLTSLSGTLQGLELLSTLLQILRNQQDDNFWETHPKENFQTILEDLHPLWLKIIN